MASKNDKPTGATMTAETGRFEVVGSPATFRIGLGRSALAPAANTTGESLAQLAEDVRKQREIARLAIDQVRNLEEIKKGIKDNDDLKKKIEEARAGLIEIARALTANSTSTSASVQSTFDLIATLAKK